MLLLLLLPSLLSLLLLLLLLLLFLSRCPAARMRSTLGFVIGSIFGSNPRS